MHTESNASLTTTGKHMAAVTPRSAPSTPPDLAGLENMLNQLLDTVRSPDGGSPQSDLDRVANCLAVTVSERLKKGGTERAEQLRSIMDTTLVDNLAVSQMIQLAMQRPGSLTEQLAMIERYLPLKQMADTQILEIIRTMHSLERPVAVGIRANQINVGAAQVNVARGENDGMPKPPADTPTRVEEDG